MWSMPNRQIIQSHLLTPEKSPIWIGCDHGGHELKSHLLAWLAERSILFHDVGCHSTAVVRYPYYAAQVAEAIVRGEAIRGILICSTGIGMSIIANKYRGIRASLCTSTYMGRMTRAHNDSNVLCLGGKITGGLRSPRHSGDVAEDAERAAAGSLASAAAPPRRRSGR